MAMYKKFIRVQIIHALALWFCFQNPELATAQRFVTDNGSVEFVSKARNETFKGTSTHLNGLIDLNSGSVDFYIDLNTLRTGISLRDEHMRESYLETKKFPFAEFTGKLNGYNPSVKDTQNVIVTGVFKLHGIEKDRTIRGRIFSDDDKLVIGAEWTVLLSDHDIAIPQLMFLKLADSQEVTIRATLTPSNDEP